jgi:hypothetical protein
LGYARRRQFAPGGSWKGTKATARRATFAQVAPGAPTAANAASCTHERAHWSHTWFPSHPLWSPCLSFFGIWRDTSSRVGAAELFRIQRIELLTQRWFKRIVVMFLYLYAVGYSHFYGNRCVLT